MPWNLSHLVGSFQSPTTTATAVTPSDYATNQSSSATGGIISATGNLPHPLPHYSSHHYAPPSQTSAANYQQADLAAWHASGVGSTGATNLGMHGQASPLTGLTSVAMAAANAVADSAPGSSTVTSVGGPYGPTKMDPENIPSMYYPHQVSIL